MTDIEPTTFLLGNEPNANPVQVYQCQKRWDELQISGHGDVRYCDSCKQSVHRVIDIYCFERAVADGRCVMIQGRSVVGGEQVIIVGEPGTAPYEAPTAKQT